jgi:hypothetical protein
MGGSHQCHYKTVKAQWELFTANSMWLCTRLARGKECLLEHLNGFKTCANSLIAFKREVNVNNIKKFSFFSTQGTFHLYCTYKLANVVYGNYRCIYSELYCYI